MDTIDKPGIPLMLEDIPQQRLHLVVNLPSMPSSFNIISGDNLVIPSDIRPHQMPRSAKFLGMVEWAWSPMHDRLDAEPVPLSISKG